MSALDVVHALIVATVLSRMHCNSDKALSPRAQTGLSVQRAPVSVFKDTLWI